MDFVKVFSEDENLVDSKQIRAILDENIDEDVSKKIHYLIATLMNITEHRCQNGEPNAEDLIASLSEANESLKQNLETMRINDVRIFRGPLKYLQKVRQRIYMKIRRSNNDPLAKHYQTTRVGDTLMVKRMD